MAGTTDSTEATFPVTVGPDLSFNGRDDAFVARIDTTGAALGYCGYIGGAWWDEGYGVAVDAFGSAYVTGYTDSSEETFPVTVGPDLTFNSFIYNADAFVAKVSSPDMLFMDGFQRGDTSAWSATVPSNVIFSDRFESGDTSAWSATVP